MTAGCEIPTVSSGLKFTYLSIGDRTIQRRTVHECCGATALHCLDLGHFQIEWLAILAPRSLL